MLFIYLLALTVAAAMWTVEAKAGRSWRAATSLTTSILIGLALSYGLALAGLCIDPYYEDNGLPEFIEWRYRWLWAGEFAGWISFLVIPVILGGASLRQALHARR